MAPICRGEEEASTLHSTPVPKAVATARDLLAIGTAGLVIVVIAACGQLVLPSAGAHAASRQPAPSGAVLAARGFPVQLAPGPPSALKAEAGEGSARLSWSAPEFAGKGGLQGYLISAEPAITPVVAEPAATSAEVHGLQDGTGYRFSVIAVSEYASSQPITSEEVTPKAPPASPPATSTVPPAAPAAPPSYRVLSVPVYAQQHALSCEAAALRMALASRGINVSESQILSAIGIDGRPAQMNSNGTVARWGNPYTNFVGSPDGSERNNTGYGTYYPTIARAARTFGAGVLAAGSLSPDQVRQAVLQGHPVVVWHAYGGGSYAPVGNFYTYTAWDGTRVPYYHGYEHSSVVVGVDGQSVLINNPWGGRQVWLDGGTFAMTYGALGDMAVVVA